MVSNIGYLLPFNSINEHPHIDVAYSQGFGLKTSLERREIDLNKQLLLFLQCFPIVKYDSFV